jgi:hypothetical protein
MSNYCLDGMCVRIKKYFKPRNTLLLRITAEDWNFSALNEIQGLRTITLGEVKWCNEILHKNSLQFEIGIRYSFPTY